MNEEMDEWDEYEEDGPMDLEDQLDAAFARADRMSHYERAITGADQKLTRQLITGLRKSQ